MEARSTARREKSEMNFRNNLTAFSWKRCRFKREMAAAIFQTCKGGATATQRSSLKSSDFLKRGKHFSYRSLIDWGTIKSSELFTDFRGLGAPCVSGTKFVLPYVQRLTTVR